MIRRIEHVGIMVKDMDESIWFYQEAFGMLIRSREQLNPDVELCFLYFEQSPDVEVELICGRPMDSEEGRVNHLAFRVENISEEMTRLVKLGAEPLDQEARTILGNVKIAFLRGLNGEKLELVER